MRKAVSLFLVFILLSQPVFACPPMGATNPLINLAALRILPSAISVTNSLSRLITLIDPQGKTTAYDPVGNRTQMTTPEGKTITYTYGPLNRLTSLKDIYGKSTTYTYDSLSRRTKVTLPNLAQTSYSYDALNNLLNLTNRAQDGSSISSYSYEYDKARNRLTKLEPDLKTSYAYDALYRLTQSTPVELKDNGEEKEKKSQLETYTYDSLGNRLSSLKDTYAYNSANQLLSTKHYTYEYDQNGNLIKKTEIDDDDKTKTTNYTYDFDNRLTQVEIQEEDEAKTVSFAYDPFGRRIKKIVTEQEEGETESKTTTYIYDNEDIILEYTTKTEDSETKQEITRYTHGPGIDEPISIERNNKLYYYHYDGLGSVTSLTDQGQKTVESYTYDSFGNLKHHGNKIKNPFTYTGREYDKETGLYYYRNRYYDPKIGRFLTQDPIGMIDGPNLYTYVDSVGKPTVSFSTNLYVYTDNNPVNFVDPWGLCKEMPWWQKAQLYLTLVGAEMEKGKMTNMQGLIGTIGVGAGAYSNIGFIPKAIGYGNKDFLQGGRMAYNWANQYGSGVKFYSWAQAGAVGSGLAIISAGMTGWTIGETINAYYWGYQDYKKQCDK